MKKLNEVIELALLEQGVFVETESTFTPLDDKTAAAVCNGLIEDHGVDKFKSKFIKSCLMKGKLIDDLGMFNNKQIYQLCRAMNKGLDYSMFADYEVSSYTMEKLIDLKLKGINLDDFYYPGISCYILKIIEMCIENKIDYTKILTRYLKKDECEHLEKIIPIAVAQNLEESFYADLVLNQLNYLDDKFYWMADQGYQLDYALKFYREYSFWVSDLKYESITPDEFLMIHEILKDNEFGRSNSFDVLVESVRSGKSIDEILNEIVDEEAIKEEELRVYLDEKHYTFSDEIIKDLLVYVSLNKKVKNRSSYSAICGNPFSIPTPKVPFGEQQIKKKSKVTIQEDLIDFMAICPEFLELRNSIETVSVLNYIMKEMIKDEPEAKVIEKMKLLVTERPLILNLLKVKGNSTSIEPTLVKDKTISDDDFVLLFNNYHRTEDYDELQKVSIDFLKIISKRHWTSHPSDWPAFLKLYNLNLEDEFIELAISSFGFSDCKGNDEVVDIVEACKHFSAYELKEIPQIISLVKYNGFDVEECKLILKSSHSAYYAKILIGAHTLGLDVTDYLSKKMAPLTVREKLLKEALRLKKVSDRSDFYRVVS